MCPSNDVPQTAVENILGWDRTLDELDYFGLLGIPYDATAEELHAAYLQFARTFHPDLHPRAPVHVRAALTRIFQRGVEAHQALSDNETALEYRRRCAKGERRLSGFRKPQAIDLRQALTTLHEHCRAGGAKLEAQQAARAYARGDLAQVELKLLASLRFDGNANPDIERCLLALAATRAPNR